MKTDWLVCEESQRDREQGIVKLFFSGRDENRNKQILTGTSR